MKISKIEISNVLGLARADLHLTGGVLVATGNNAAGKSSIADAISMAFLGKARRVDLKKDLGQLLHDDSAKGRVSITLEGEDMGAEFRLPKGEHSASEFAGSQYLPFVLDAAKFCAITADERRTMLFGLTGIKASGKLIAEKLAARGVSDSMIEDFAPMLRGGFPSASKEAYTRATAAKGAWRATTGENWGSEKAEGWKPAAPGISVPSDAELEALFTRHEKQQAGVEKAVKFLGGLESKRQASESFVQRKQDAADTAESLVRRQAKQQATEKQIAAFEPELAEKVARLNTMKSGAEPVACPCCQAKLKIVGNTLEEFVGLDIDVKQRSDLALEVSKGQSALEMLRRTLANDIASVAEAKAAGDLFDKIVAEKVEVVDEDLIERTKTALAEQRVILADYRADYNAAFEAQGQATKLVTIAADAAKHHAEVRAWLQIGDALAPDGIPGELLSDALAPVNQSLEVLAGMCGWHPVVIRDDMAVTFGGRLYGICSESERWRADCLLALAIAQISNLRMVVLDRFDVLDAPSRIVLLKLLLELYKMDLMDTQIMCGTMKGPMNPMHGVQCVWIANAIAETGAAA